MTWLACVEAVGAWPAAKAGRSVSDHANSLPTSESSDGSQKSICALTFAKRAVITDVGVSQFPLAMNDWL